jgi:HAD superfamily hydrolase (TIGR01509 family)
MRAIVFDVFGTLCEIGDPRRPFGRLLRHLHNTGYDPHDDPARWLMSRPLDLRATVAELGASAAVSDDLIAALESDLQAELASVRLFPDVLPALAGLRSTGVKIGVCSNLAAPYAAPVLSLLPNDLDFYGWSFEIGAIKPDRAIYQAVCRSLACAPEDVLFVGDTEDADVDGPRAFGMKAVHLDRDGTSTAKTRIASLAELPAHIEKLSRQPRV